ncbi:MAG: isochorismatase family protein [Pseudomonadota bacterium]
MSMSVPSPTAELCVAAESQLVVVDVQERLAAAMEPEARERVVRNSAILAQAAQRLALPSVVSEQYPKGLGATVSALSTVLDTATTVVEKSCFACGASPDFSRQLASGERRQVVLAGMESHVCVLQTALGLLAEGYSVFVCEDAACSRSAENHRNAMARMRQAGVVISNTESVLFEWLRDARHEQFKAISALIR